MSTQSIPLLTFEDIAHSVDVISNDGMQYDNREREAAGRFLKHIWNAEPAEALRLARLAALELFQAHERNPAPDMTAMVENALQNVIQNRGQFSGKREARFHNSLLLRSTLLGVAEDTPEARQFHQDKVLRIMNTMLKRLNAKNPTPI